MMVLFTFLLVLFMFQNRDAFSWQPTSDTFPNYKQSSYSRQGKSSELRASDPGRPLLVTPLIQARKISQALNEAQVFHKDFFGVKSFSGFFTVDRAYNSNLFFWFFPAEQDYTNAPLILWLQGGPGDSSLSGLFVENGSFEIKSKDKVYLRTHRWAKKHSVLYVDNPVGTGFSFTNNGFCQNQTKVARDLYEVLHQFYMLFPDLKKNPFFITGESYAGKYIPMLAYQIDQENAQSDSKINLQGLAIASGLTDPINQFGYASYLYQIGLIDLDAKTDMEAMQENHIRYINNEDWFGAYKECVKIFTIIMQYTGMKHLFSYVDQFYPIPKLNSYVSEYVTRSDIRRALHVGNIPFNSSGVYANLVQDTMKSVAPYVSKLLSKYRVLIYNGQVDVIIAYPLTVNYLQRLEFNGAKEYKEARRKQWWIKSDLAGYVKVAGNLTEVLVRNAGHSVVHDQPEWIYELIYKFIRNLPITSY